MTIVAIPRSTAVSSKIVEPSDFEKYWSDIIVDYVETGLALSAGAGLNVNIAVGECRIKGIHIEITVAETAAVTASMTNFVFMKLVRDVNSEVQEAQIEVNTTGTPPTDGLKLGEAVADGSSVTSVDNATGVIKDHGLLTLTNVATISGAKTFQDNKLLIQNPAATFAYTITGAAIAAARTLNLPLTTATDTLASLGLAQTFTATQTMADLIHTGRHQTDKGSDIASTGIITLGGDGNVFDITGTTTINEILATDWQAGSKIVLRFDGILTVTNNSGGTNDILTADGANFVTAAGDKLYLFFNGTDWEEISRSVVGGGGISNVVEDTTPQLGGNLDGNGFDIELDASTLITFDGATQAQTINGAGGGIIFNVPTADEYDFKINAASIFKVATTSIQPQSGISLNMGDDPITDVERISFPRSTLTIATGAVTITRGVHRIDTEASASTDDLDAITISAWEGRGMFTFRSVNAARDPTIKDTTNIEIAGDFTLDNIEDTLLSEAEPSTKMREVSRSNNL